LKKLAVLHSLHYLFTLFTKHLIIVPPQCHLYLSHYQLRQRVHDRQLPAHYGYLFDCNFITRLLYTDIY